MAKNAVDAHRKALRKKEIKKNKEDRKKVREISTVKKDTRPIEADIRKLTSKRDQSASDKEQLASLRAELERINGAKNAYVEAHPEHRKFVFPERQNAEGSSSEAGPSRDPPGLYTKDGKLKHPERSIYYDPVFNPFGAPPPGMPYRERPPTAEELAAFMPRPLPLPVPAAGEVSEEEDDDEGDSDEDEEDDEDIPLPEGSPPGSDDNSDADSDDSLADISMPEGPPPPKPLPIPTGPRDGRVTINRPNTGPRQHYPYPYPPPQHFQHPPRPHFQHPPPHMQGPPRQPHHLPARPPPPSQFDPITGEPITNYQAHQHAKRNEAKAQEALPRPSGDGPLPPPPASTAAAQTGLPTPLAVSAAPAAIISAAPQLRDLKKEATAFVPSNLRRKQKTAASTPQTAASGLGAIDAARGGSENQVGERASLMGALKEVGIGGTAKKEGGQTKAERAKEDYARFEAEMAEFL